MTDFLAAALVVLLVGVIAARAVDDARHPKTVLVRADWTCRRSHTELEVRTSPSPAGGEEHELVPDLVCDAWSRR